ncbi:MAG: hypothetical protein QMD13_07905 [Candidatus Bathyarchaeia archaeon]|nr:hypothetical protein [Candidatus Bathyarchaeia archaeon]
MKEVEEVKLKFSGKYLERILNDAIVELMHVGEKDIQVAAQKQVDDIFKVLATPTVNWTIIVPIVNLKMELDELRIGKVRLFTFKADDKKRLQSEIVKIYEELQSKSTNLPKDIPSSLISVLEKDLEKNFGILLVWSVPKQLYLLLTMNGHKTLECKR